ncbi:hypothetical protein GCM10018785_70130 [Streptomyces longispororuber]|uniref:Uncharacterized protein n=1 Tax=Streptomyces longispororuber TaxID=68230 RepID=A0A919DZF0_9ACTN|nr:hypothetical protein GCM10018785_70130 [Streptomyces longispororuber]
MGGVGEVDVRLGGAVEEEGPGVGAVAVGQEFGEAAVHLFDECLSRLPSSPFAPRHPFIIAGYGTRALTSRPTPTLPTPMTAAPAPPAWGSAPLPRIAAPRLVLNRRTG